MKIYTLKKFIKVPIKQRLLRVLNDKSFSILYTLQVLKASSLNAFPIDYKEDRA